MFESTKAAFRKLLFEYSVSLIVIFLVLGLYFRSVPAYNFVGDYFISGGVMGLIVYWLLSRHEEHVLRQELLGIGENESLVERLAPQEVDFFHTARLEEWELIDGGKRWDSKLVETFHIYVKKDIPTIRFSRRREASLTCRIREGAGKWTTAEVQRLSEPSYASMTTYQVSYNFAPGRLYTLELTTYTRKSFEKDGDFLVIRSPAPSHSTKLYVKLPSSVDLADYEFHSFVHDMRWKRVRELRCIRKGKRIMVVQQGFEGMGPLLVGEDIFVKYNLRRP